MTSLPNLDHLTPEQLRALAAQLMQRVESLDQAVETMGKKIHRDQTVIEKLTHEIAQLKRLKFAKRSEQLNPAQASLLEDLIDTDIAAIEAELQALQTPSTPAETRQNARLNGHEPYTYLKDVLTRLPTQRASDIAQLLPHRWQPV
jgi:septal ring factor EnvC (AmiA/AmiB activator)